MRQLFTFIHVSLTSLSGVQYLLLRFVSFVTTALGINLIQTLIMFMGLSRSGLWYSKVAGLLPEVCFINFAMI